MTGFLRTMGLALALGVFSTVAYGETIRFGAGQQGSQNYGVNTALAQAIETGTDLDVSVQSFGGATAYLPLLESGELDMAAVVTPDFGDAVRGSGPFEGNPLKSLRLVSALMPSPVGIMVRADSGIDSIPDLKGKRVAWGMPAQASLLPYVEGAIANGGLTRDDIIQVPVASVGKGVAALISGKVDATLFALRAGKVVEADAATGGVKWLPFDASAEAVARMKELAPEAYLFNVAGDAGVVGIDSTRDTMAYDYVLVAREGVSDEAITRVTELLVNSFSDIAGANPILGALSEEAILREYPSIESHPAAKAVLRK